MENADWTCTIEEGAAGLSSACWAPDSRHILTCADFQVRNRGLPCHSAEVPGVGEGESRGEAVGAAEQHPRSYSGERVPIHARRFG